MVDGEDRCITSSRALPSMSETYPAIVSQCLGIRILSEDGRVLVA